MKDSTNRFRIFKLLLKHFIRRFLYNDILSIDHQQKTTIFFLSGVLAASGSYISFKLMGPYLSGIATADKIWMDTTFFFTVMMAFTGIVFVVVWDRVFLDSEEFHNLIPLPVRMRTIVFAKLLSVLVFIAGISLVFGLPSVLIFTVALTGTFPIDAAPFAFWYSVALLAANMCMGLMICLVQITLNLVFRKKYFLKVSLVVQTLLLTGFISMFALLPMVLYDRLPALKQSNSQLIYLFPPLWFSGFLESMLGSGDISFNTSFLLVMVILPILLVVYAIGFSIQAHKVSRVQSDYRSEGRPKGRINRWLRRIENKLIKEPVEKSLFHFTLRLLKRNRQYKIHLTILLVLPFGFLLSLLLYLNHDRMFGILYSINFYTLSILPILGFFLAVGLRTAVLHPDTLEANWVFKATENPMRKRYYMRGLIKALTLFAPLPLFAIFCLFYAYFWGIGTALLHTIYSFLFTQLLIQLFFFNYRRIPFASAYSEKNLNIKLWWPVYIVVFLGYAWAVTNMELLLLENPAVMIATYIALVLSILGIETLGNSRSKQNSFIFEDQQEPTLGGD